MSTRSNIGIIELDGKCRTVYCHWDGYPTGVGAELLDCYNDEQKARELVAGGSMSSITTYSEGGENETHTPKRYDDHPRGEWDKVVYENLSKVVEDFRRSDAEYLYMFDCKVGKWMVTGMSSRFGHHPYYKGKAWEDLEIRVKDDLEHTAMAEDKEDYWRPPKRQVKGMYSVFGANGRTMQPVEDYDLPVGLPLIAENGYGCGGYSCCWIADKEDNGRRMTYTLIGYEWGDERERDGRPYWYKTKTDGDIRPYSEKFGIGYYFDDRFTNPRLMPKEDIVAIMKEIEENERLEKEAEERRIAEENAKYDMGKLMFEVAMNKYEEAFKEKPKAVIVAVHEVFDGDWQTDYYSTAVTRRIPLAFSRYEKRNKQEMVKACMESGQDWLADFVKTDDLRMEEGALKNGPGLGWKICKYPLGPGAGHYWLNDTISAMADNGDILLKKY